MFGSRRAVVVLCMDVATLLVSQSIWQSRLAWSKLLATLDSAQSITHALTLHSPMLTLRVMSV